MTPQDRMFLDAWERKTGRPLRVLHIGNIANNAYNNAKIQRRFGIDADVLSFDYYHIMACPEWEDADFKGTIKNDMFPDWWSVDLRGFRRPRWFAQGPLDASVRYLIAKTSGKRSARQWNWLEFERWLLCRTGFLNKAARFAIHRWTGQPVALVSAPANALIMKRSARLATILATAPGIRGTRVGRRISFIGRKLSIHARTAGAMDDARHAKLMKKYASAAGRSILRVHDASLGSLCDYEWPGNVRQLENTVERAVALEMTDELHVELPAERPKARAAAAGAGALPDPGGDVTLPEGMGMENYVAGVERTLLRNALNQSGGVQTKAADVLGISYRSFRHLMKKYGL